MILLLGNCKGLGLNYSFLMLSNLKNTVFYDLLFFHFIILNMLAQKIENMNHTMLRLYCRQN